MVKIDWAGMVGREAADFLSEGDPAKAIEILESDMEISRELRTMIATMLKGYGPNNTKLKIVGTGGEWRKTRRLGSRDLDLYCAVEDEINKSGCSIQEACNRLSGLRNVGAETIRKAYQGYNKVIRETRED